MRAVIALAIILLAGCVQPEVAPPAPGALVAGEPVLVDAERWASEPDLASLPDGTLLACGVPRGSESQMFLWRRPPGGAFERVAHPAGDGTIDCAWGVDAGGVAYFATSAGADITVAATRDGATWDAEGVLGDGAAAYDRPWVAGGAAGRALVIGYHAAKGVQAWATTDAGATWDGPWPASRQDQLVFQAFGNLVWLGDDAYAYAYGLLEPHGAGVEAHDLWLARTDDGGRTWSHAPAAEDRGNVNNIFPWLAVDAGGALHLAWAESGEGGRPVVVHHARSVDGSDWTTPVPVHGSERTGLMPRVVATSDSVAIAYYSADGEVQPSLDAASWDVVLAREAEGVWETTPVAEGIHEGTVATGGYGAIADQVARNPGSLGTANSQELLHHLGATRHPDGRLAIAWAADSNGPARVWMAEITDPRG